MFAVRAEVVQQPRVEEFGDFGAVHELAGLPGVQWQYGPVFGQGEAGPGEAGDEMLRGDGAAAFRPGGVLGSTEGLTDIQCRGKEPRNSGE